jgi:hypothetical protein
MKTITTNQAFGVSMYAANGSMSYGFKTLMKSATLTIPSEDAQLTAFTTALDFGEAYPQYPITREFTIMNIGNSEGEYVASCDGDGFTITPTSGTIEALGSQTFTITFNGTEVGDYEGIVTIESESDPILVQLNAVCIAAPDYTPIVTKGDISFATGMDYPFELSTDLVDGKTVAKSTNTYAYGDSYLTAKFNVPEGKIGKLTWKGAMNIGTYFRVSSGIYADGESAYGYNLTYVSGSDIDISGEYQFAPGDHEMKFDYNVVYYSYGTDTDWMYIYDLALEYEDMEADKASINTNELSYGNFLYDGEEVTKTMQVTFLNEGSNDFKVLSASETENFSAVISDASVATLDRLNLNIEFKANEAKEYNQTMTITTTAGDFDVNLKALVRQMPDYSSIVDGGDFTFSTSADYPYVLSEDGTYAYNCTSKVEDTQYTNSFLKAEFVVPEGKLGIISWKANLSCTPIEFFDDGSYAYHDIGYMWLQKQNGGYTILRLGEENMSSDAGFDFGDDWLYCTPGSGYVMAQYCQEGDSKYDGEDMLTFSHLKLELIDFEENKAELLTPNVEFDTVYAGKKSSSTVSFKNLGSSNLSISGVDAEGPFFADFNTWTYAQFGGQLNVTVYFQPTEAGEQQGSLTFHTSAGDFVVECSGEAMSTDNIILLEDFEDSAANWRILDLDGDGYCWDLAYNLFGGYPQAYVHTGNECLGSASWQYYAGNLTPDNWTFSPSFTVPEEGATLTWWIAAQSESSMEDVYDVYVAEGDLATHFSESNYTSVYHEMLSSTEWQERFVDLSDYIGKTIHVAFRHHDCTGMYLMKLDDVIVYRGTDKVISNFSDADILNQEYYTLDGLRISQPDSDGIYIVKTNYLDGSSKVTKIVSIKR